MDGRCLPHTIRLTVFPRVGGPAGAGPAPPGGQNLHCTPHPGAQQPSSIPLPPTTPNPSWGKAPEDPRSGLAAQRVQGPPPEGQAIGRRVSDRSVTVWGEKAGNRLPLSPTAKGSLH